MHGEDQPEPPDTLPPLMLEFGRARGSQSTQALAGCSENGTGIVETPYKNLAKTKDSG